MNKHHPDDNSIHNQLKQLSDTYCLTEKQIIQFERYLSLLIEWNQKFNLTAITSPEGIIQYHFNDSLALVNHIDLAKATTTADIGTGAGFPGIPLKIVFPHLQTILIEVNSKKRSFLAHIIQELELDNVIIYPSDWRTFLRTTSYAINYFFARASLQPEELVRAFKATSPYQQTTLVYWASQQWITKKIESQFIEKELHYTIESIQRKFVFFKQRS